MDKLVLYGVPLGLLAVATIKFLQDKFGLADEVADIVRAVAGVVIYVVIQNADAILEWWPYFEVAVIQFGGALALFLTILGYWKDIQRISYRVTGRALPPRLK